MLQQGKRKIELTETILSNKLPEEKKALYEHIHMINEQTTGSEKINAIHTIHTLYISGVEHTKFIGFVPKLKAKVFPGLSKKQSEKWMNQFKVFAEGTEKRALIKSN